MAGRTSWLVDSRRIASKIKNASEPLDPNNQKWISNPTKPCPRCNHVIDNSDVVAEWPGLPKGVKFDPSDQELIWHLLTKAGKVDAEPHPFIDEFIPTVEEDEGICYTHPKRLPGVKQDGSVSHFFHKTFKAYNTGTRKRRKINADDLGDVRWHKTGKTKPVILDGKHLGCKKIMVLYMNPSKGGKAEKTNWVMHQYHLGTDEDEKDGEYVVSKLFHQQLTKPGERTQQELIVTETLEAIATEVDAACEDVLVGVDQTGCPLLPLPEQMDNTESMSVPEPCRPQSHVQVNGNEDIGKQPDIHVGSEKVEEQGGNFSAEDNKWWEGESQFLLDSQQLAENIAICEEFLQSQNSTDAGNPKKARLADYACLGAEDFKKDLEACQKLGKVDDANPELDNPPDLRFSQLEFGSQDSFLTWAAAKLADSET